MLLKSSALSKKKCGNRLEARVFPLLKKQPGLNAVVGRVVAGVQEGCEFVEELFCTERKENCAHSIPEQQQIFGRCNSLSASPPRMTKAKSLGLNLYKCIEPFTH